jgi:hypothetical protein
VSWHWDDGQNTGHLDPTGLIARWTVDDALAEDLGDALAEQAVAQRVTASASTAFAAHRGMLAARANLDLELMLLTLVYDSHESPEALAVRDRSGGSSRTLVFESDNLGVEVEIESGGIEGQLIPPRAGRVTLRSPDQTIATAETDEVGYFRFDVHPGGLLRLECTNAEGTCVTEWLPW